MILVGMKAQTQTMKDSVSYPLRLVSGLFKLLSYLSLESQDLCPLLHCKARSWLPISIMPSRTWL